MFKRKYYNILFIFLIVVTLFILLKIEKEQKISNYINSLSAERKIGQLLMVAPNSYYFDKELKLLIKKYYIGNIKIYGKNYKNKYQLNKLIIFVQNYSISNNEIPMLVATDQEGGWIAHLKKGFTIPPSNFALARTGLKYLAYISGDVISKELSYVGINVNFAPDVDLHINGKNRVIGPRAYSESPEVVIKFANEFISAHIHNNIIPVIKHFPGHGSVTGDSHIALLTNRTPYTILKNTELKPFIYLTRTPETGIMIGHIAVPGIVRFLERINGANYKNYYYYPASTSKIIIKKYLLEFLKYKGLIFTDEMSMGGIIKKFSLEKAVFLSIKAGANIIVLNRPFNETVKIYKYLVNKYYSDKEFKKQVDLSIDKIFIYKGIVFQNLNTAGYFSKKLFKIKKFVYDPKKLNKINSPIFKKVIFDISKQTTDIFRDKHKIIPLNKTGVYKNKNYIVISPRKSLYLYLKDFVNYTKIKYIPIKTGFTERFSNRYTANILSKIDNKSVILFGIISSENAKLCKKVYMINKNIIIINFLHLYNIKNFNKIDTILNTFSDNSLQIQAAMEVLFNGKSKILNLHKEYLTF